MVNGMKTKHNITLALLFGMLVMLSVIVGCEQDITPEQYFAEEYPGFEIVKTSEVGDLQAYLIKDETGMIMVCFYNGEPLGALGSPENNLPSSLCCYFRSGYPTGSTVIIIYGENVTSPHTTYSCSWFEADPDDLSDKRYTDVTRDITDQQYVLDIYDLSLRCQMDFNSMKFEDGTKF